MGDRECYTEVEADDTVVVNFKLYAAALCFGCSAVIFAVAGEWPMVPVFAGLCILTLERATR